MAAHHAAIDRLFEGWTGPDTPGLVVAATRNGAIVHQGAYGMADLAHGIPLGPRSVVRIGSQTKQFTVLLALMLEREGKLDMHAPVHRYAPWLAALPHTVTLRHLASNTSDDFLEMMTWSGRPCPAPPPAPRPAPSSPAMPRSTSARRADDLLQHRLLPAERDHRGGAPAAASTSCLRSRITGPLGMEDTILQQRDSQILPRAAMHHSKGPDGAWNARIGASCSAARAGDHSTLEDMLRWQAHLANPTAEMADLLARMEQPTRFNNGSLSMYALGFTVTRYRGLHNIGHGGGVAGGRSESVRFPSELRRSR